MSGSIHKRITKYDKEHDNHISASLVILTRYKEEHNNYKADMLSIISSIKHIIFLVNYSFLGNSPASEF